MTDIDETIDGYESACKDVGIQPNSHFQTVLEQEQKDAPKRKRRGEKHDTMHLYLAGNNKLITDYRLNDQDCLVLYKWLRNNLYVISMDLRYNNITDDGAKHIGKLIEETACLKELNIMCNDICKEGAKHIAAALHKNDTLVVLQVNGNKMGTDGGMYFAQALQINTTLERLDLGDTDQKTESIIALATVLNYNTTLKALNVNRPILFSQQEETTVHYANVLKVNKTLTELHLQKCDIRDFGATRLAENLYENYTLQYLNLNCNRITRDGAKELAKLLRKDTPLKVLDLGYNRLGDDGAKHLAEALATYNTSLTSLVLTSNEIRGKGLCAIADCMKMNTTLSSVYIWGNELEESASIAFAALMDSGRLEEDNTDVKPYMVDGSTHLAEVCNGIRTFYYWAPAYGKHADPNLAKFVKVH